MEYEEIKFPRLRHKYYRPCIDCGKKGTVVTMLHSNLFPKGEYYAYCICVDCSKEDDTGSGILYHPYKAMDEARESWNALNKKVPPSTWLPKSNFYAKKINDKKEPPYQIGASD